MNWIEVKTKDDIKNLLDVFDFFHDGCLREIHLWNSYYIGSDLSMAAGEGTLNAKVIFQRQSKNPSAIEVCFSEVQRMNIVATNPNYWYMILGASLFYKGGLYYWADEEQWNISEPSNSEIMWISAKGIKWRDKSEWMKDTLRYGSRE
ncbi:hypothetical protein [Clostridium akagii]|uniref:hypothetical protein n=1 Tax=Clostridium akagii TaxID=91623 RepID=UPI00047E3C1F|nr:hypothetical protein [Clostridium akagii]